MWINGISLTFKIVYYNNREEISQQKWDLPAIAPVFEQSHWIAEHGPRCTPMNNGTPCVYVEPCHKVTHEQASKNSAQSIPGEDSSFVFHVGNKSESTFSSTIPSVVFFAWFGILFTTGTGAFLLEPRCMHKVGTVLVGSAWFLWYPSLKSCVLPIKPELE